MHDHVVICISAARGAAPCGFAAQGRWRARDQVVVIDPRPEAPKANRDGVTAVLGSAEHRGEHVEAHADAAAAIIVATAATTRRCW